MFTTLNLKHDLGKLLLESRLNKPLMKTKGKKKIPKGFIIENKFKCSGAVKRLENTFYSNFRQVGVCLTADGLKNKRKSKVKRNGGMISGSIFHRQVYHFFKCGKNPKDCSCLSRFGQRTRTVLGKRSIAVQRLTALQKFLASKGLYVFECELVTAILEGKCATAIDLICVNDLKNPTQIWIIELKTGYRTNKDQPSTFDRTGMMCGEGVKHIPNTYANHHQLQLWFEMESFEQTYGIKPTGGMVIYLNKSEHKLNTYVCTSVPAQSWWYGNKGMRRLLLNAMIKG
jgi:hypothetical protein